MSRPFGTLKYDNIKDLEKGIDQYFKYCDDNSIPYTMYGLADSLNIHYATLYNYSKTNYSDASKEYFEPISRAKQRCIGYAERRLYDRDGAQGAKFALINNAKHDGWSDRHDISMDVSAAVSFVDMSTEPDPDDAD